MITKFNEFVNEGFKITPDDYSYFRRQIMLSRSEPKELINDLIENREEWIESLMRTARSHWELGDGKRSDFPEKEYFKVINQVIDEIISERNEFVNESKADIPDRYKKKGFTKVGVKKRAPEGAKHKWEVLAKKGDKYKIVKGGARGMEDFTQHKDSERRKSFWSRMGGKNSERAKDPFSPLYWHKKFGTW